MSSYTVYFIIFACLACLIVTDESVAKAVVFLSQLARFEYEKLKWWLIMNPKSPWGRYSIHRRSNQLAKELMKELEDKTK
jgi:hypothetical protein